MPLSLVLQGFRFLGIAYTPALNGGRTSLLTILTDGPPMGWHFSIPDQA